MIQVKEQVSANVQSFLRDEDTSDISLRVSSAERGIEEFDFTKNETARIFDTEKMKLERGDTIVITYGMDGLVESIRRNN